MFEVLSMVVKTVLAHNIGLFSLVVYQLFIYLILFFQFYTSLFLNKIDENNILTR